MHSEKKTQQILYLYRYRYKKTNCNNNKMLENKWQQQKNKKCRKKHLLIQTQSFK